MNDCPGGVAVWNVEMIVIFVSFRKWSLQSAVYRGGRPRSLLLLPRVLADDRWTHV